MYKTEICFTDVKDVSNFVEIANNYDFNINIISEKCIINAKSLMGIFSLPLSKQLHLKAECDGDSSFVASIDPYVVRV